MSYTIRPSYFGCKNYVCIIIVNISTKLFSIVLQDEKLDVYNAGVQCKGVGFWVVVLKKLLAKFCFVLVLVIRESKLH